MQNKSKKENILDPNKLVKESLRELLGQGLVEGKKRKEIKRNFLQKYTLRGWDSTHR